MKLLEGGTLDPNSGTADLSGELVPAGHAARRPARRYTGVQDYNDYTGSPDFYDPDSPRPVRGLARLSGPDGPRAGSRSRRRG